MMCVLMLTYWKPGGSMKTAFQMELFLVHKYFKNIHRRFCEKGSFKPDNRGFEFSWERSRINYMENSNQFENFTNSYFLLYNNFPLQMSICLWFLEKLFENPLFNTKILFTDEANCSRNAIQNFHNNYLWAEGNPHAFIFDSYGRISQYGSDPKDTQHRILFTEISK